MTPKISIIVPIYNVEKYLDRCIQSLLHQTLQDIEIILVDDESPDKCPELCDVYATQYENDNRPTVKVVHKKNGGLGMACNSGLEVATGEYVAFCDSDDWVEMNTYDEMYKAATENKADVVMTGIQSINDAGVTHLMNQPERFELMTDRQQILHYAMNMIATEPSDPVQRRIAMSAKIMLYRRALLEENHLRFESERKLISEDLIWNLDVLGHATCVVTLPKTFYYYYNNTSSISKKLRLDRFPFFKTIRLELIRRTAAMGYSEEVKERIDRMFLAEVRHDVGNILLADLPWSQRSKMVKTILSDGMTQSVLSSFPIGKLTKVQQIIMQLMQGKMIVPLYLLFRIKR